jgi:hypothetical protein
MHSLQMRSTLISFLFAVEATHASVECHTDIGEWLEYWRLYNQCLSDPGVPGLLFSLRSRLYDLVLLNHSRVLECNTGVVAGYYLIGEQSLSTDTELAYRSFQMAMIFVYTLRSPKQTIPSTSEIEWRISKDRLLRNIIGLKRDRVEVLPVPGNVVKSSPSAIAIVSICAYPSNSSLILKDITPLNRRRYAVKHGYDTIVLDHHPLGPEPTVSIQHSKLELMRSLVDSRKYEWIMWTDCDSIIINTDLTLESIIAEYVTRDNIDLLITEELLGLSSANWLIRSSDWASRFLRKAFRIASNELPLFGDQDAIISLAIGKGSLDPHIQIIPQHVINAYDALNAYTMGSGEYRSGDLLISFPQCHDSTCNVLFYEAFKASEDSGVSLFSKPVENRTSSELRVFGPPHVIGKLYFEQYYRQSRVSLTINAIFFVVADLASVE